MYISRIYLKNIRGFGELNLDLMEKKSGNSTLSPSPRMRTIIIGKNGTCKTTLLRCVAIGLADKKDASGLLAEDIGQLISEDSNTATIEIVLAPENSGSKEFKIITTLGSEKKQDFLMKKEPESLDRELFVCGYGALRFPGGEDKFRAYRIIDSVYTLFSYDQPNLVGSEIALRRLRDFLGTGIYKKTMKRIKEALGLGQRDKIDLPKGGGVVVSGPEIGRHVPLEGWADGYRMTFGWLLDIYAWAMRANCLTSSGHIRGTILLDEMEQHLHPSMQIDLLNRFSELFPDLQIIATTHSPLVALGALPKEIVVLRREGKRVIADSEMPDFSGYSAEDMLADSKLFDSDVYSPETNKKLTEYRRIISKPAKTRKKTEEDRLKSLTAELMAQEVLEDKHNKIDKQLKKLITKYEL